MYMKVDAHGIRVSVFPRGHNADVYIIIRESLFVGVPEKFWHFIINCKEDVLKCLETETNKCFSSESIFVAVQAGGLSLTIDDRAPVHISRKAFQVLMSPDLAKYITEQMEFLNDQKLFLKNMMLSYKIMLNKFEEIFFASEDYHSKTISTAFRGSLDPSELLNEFEKNIRNPTNLKCLISFSQMLHFVEIYF